MEFAYEVNLGDVAHIVGRKRSTSSPRGDDPLAIDERNNADNLMLLCSEHHHKIADKRQLVPDFPRDRLRRMKREHEEHILGITELGDERGGVVVRMVGQIRKTSSLISNDAVSVTPPASPGARRRFRSLYVRDLS